MYLEEIESDTSTLSSSIDRSFKEEVVSAIAKVVIQAYTNFVAYIPV